MRNLILRKIREKRKLSKEENDWLNKMITGPKVLRRILRDALGIKNETISDKKN